MNTEGCVTQAPLQYALIIVDRITVGIDRYFGTQDEADIVLHALTNYKHLLQAKRVSASSQRFTFREFADAISSVYDASEGRVALIVATLRTLDARQCEMVTGAGLNHL